MPRSIPFSRTKSRERGIAIAIAQATEIDAIITFVPWVAMVSTVQKRTIVIKLSAGQKIHVSIFAIVLDADSGRIFVFAATKPTAIQRKSVNIGVSVAKKVAIISHQTSQKFFSTYYYITASRDCQEDYQQKITKTPPK